MSLISIMMKQVLVLFEHECANEFMFTLEAIVDISD